MRGEKKENFKIRKQMRREKRDTTAHSHVTESL
jgi:hypothetical protein